MKDMNNISRKEIYETAEEMKYGEDIICDWFIIIPNRYKHDSWYWCFDIFWWDETEEKLYAWKWYQDALHFEKLQDLPFPKINMDILYKSKATRYFADCDFSIRWGLSDVFVKIIPRWKIK